MIVCVMGISVRAKRLSLRLESWIEPRKAISVPKKGPLLGFKPHIHRTAIIRIGVEYSKDDIAKGTSLRPGRECKAYCQSV